MIARLGLRRTFTAGASAYLPRPAATGYTRFPGTDQLTDTSVFVPLPDTSVISTTGDVAEFFRALFDGRLLGQAELARLRETTAARDRRVLAAGRRVRRGCLVPRRLLARPRRGGGRHRRRSARGRHRRDHLAPRLRPAAAPGRGDLAPGGPRAV